MSAALSSDQNAVSLSERGDTVPGIRVHLTAGAEPVNPETDIVLDPSLRASLIRSGVQLRRDHPDPYPDDQSLEAARVDVTTLVNGTVADWAHRLNRRHNREWSVDFWRMLTLPWICEIIQRVHARWHVFDAVARAGEGPVRIRTAAGIERWPFPDLRSLQKHLFEDPLFGWWIDSVILNARADHRFDLEPHDTDPEAALFFEEARPAPIAGFRRLKLALGHTDLIGSRYGGLLLALLANLIPARTRHSTMQPISPPDWRDRFPPSMLAAIDTVLTASIPRTYADDFEALEAGGQRFRYRAGRVRLGTIDYWNDDEKIVAALGREAGEKIAVAQHGGFYGQMRYNVLATEGEYRYGRFFTWGFDRHDDYDADLVPLPSPLLSRLANSHRERSGDLLLVGDPIRFGVTRIAPPPRGVQWLDYCEDTVDYLRALDPAPLAKSRFRPYANAQTDISDQHITEAFPDLGRVEGDLHSHMARCRLLQLCSPNTTMIIAMAANVPLLGFWRPEFFTLSKSAEPFFDRLRAVGVLFDTPGAAAGQVNAVWENVDEWWAGSEIQAARREWVDRFARNSRFWWAPWAREIWRTARAA